MAHQILGIIKKKDTPDEAPPLEEAKEKVEDQKSELPKLEPPKRELIKPTSPKSDEGSNLSPPFRPRADRAYRSDSGDRSDRGNSNRGDRTDRGDRGEKREWQDRGERGERPERPNKIKPKPLPELSQADFEGVTYVPGDLIWVTSPFGNKAKAEIVGFYLDGVEVWARFAPCEAPPEWHWEKGFIRLPLLVKAESAS